ncbi:MAG: clostripain-related cysteine peptidase [Candidatus Dependentiae bacterium]|nr:clostripain-related cysteine peptidase [Candidatus Dependentiae bacterium]
MKMARRVIVWGLVLFAQIATGHSWQCATTAKILGEAAPSTRKVHGRRGVQWRKTDEAIARSAQQRGPAVELPARKKTWTILVYMAADNDLYPFATQNLAQMHDIGSNDQLHLIVHLDLKEPNRRKVTRRLYVEKGRIIQIGPDAKLNSGSDETFANFTLWAIQNYPSEHLAIIFWNHGSGDLNPVLRKTVNPAYLFRYNPETNMIDLDRSIGFIEFIDMISNNNEPVAPEVGRGICFDETFRSYLDDEKLMRALGKICTARNGKKIDMVIFDACLMAGTGTAWIMSQFADYMVASEEVVLGPGYNYRLALAPFAAGNQDCKAVAQRIVACYEQTYQRITNDYTHSALDLAQYGAMCENIDSVANLLIEALAKQRDMSVKNVIRACRSRYMCTSFDEPSYIDLLHLYENLINKLPDMRFVKKRSGETLRQNLLAKLREGVELSKQLIIANVRGINLAGAHGISIYFPEFKINNPHHASYAQTEFAKHNSWLKFLQAYQAL